MSKTVYGGFIVREYFDSDGFLCEAKSEERIFVKTDSKELAKKMILKEYTKNPKKWVPSRPPKKFPKDKLFVRTIKSIDELLK